MSTEKEWTEEEWKEEYRAETKRLLDELDNLDLLRKLYSIVLCAVEKKGRKTPCPRR